MTGPPGPRSTPKPSAKPSDGPRRADALRNREQVIAAAEAVFAEQGVEAAIPEIAERAGVGKGTVYRNFDSKEDLIAAVLARRMMRFDQDIETGLQRDDPGAAVREVLQRAAARANALSFPAGIYLPGKHPEFDRLKRQAKGKMAKLIESAQEAGEIRTDATMDELFVLFGGICRALAESGEADPEAWRRHTDLVVDAFRPGPAG